MGIQLYPLVLDDLFPEFPQTMNKGRFCELFNRLSDMFLMPTAKNDESKLARISHFLGQIYEDSRHFMLFDCKKERGRFRGRGFFKCRGIDEYLALSAWWYGDLRLIEEPSIVYFNFEMRFVSSFWKWNTSGCNALADKGNYYGLVRVLHSGKLPDFVERIKSTEHIMKTLRKKYGIAKD